MVEVANQIILVCEQRWFGFNISELVTSIVGAEIEPKRAIHTSKQNKNDNAITGLGFLNSKSLATKTGFTSVTDDILFCFFI